MLGQLARNQSGITLMNIYKGLPMSYEGSINGIGATEIQVRSNRYHIACLYHQRETFLQAEGLPVVVRSQVLSLNLAKETALLSNFSTANNSIGKRGQVRVEADDSLEATIQFKEASFEIPVPLADISTGGASIYCESQLFPSRVLQNGSELSMTISFRDTTAQKLKKISSKPLIEGRDSRSFLRTNLLGSEDDRISIKAQGVVVSVRPELQLRRFRLGVKLYFKDLSRSIVAQYIAKRQAEIIQDLRTLSEELYSLKR
jgi:hypothetical protein